MSNLGSPLGFPLSGKPLPHAQSPSPVAAAPDRKRHAVVGYNSGQLQIQFPGGHIYQYEQVPQEVYDAVSGSESVGKAFHEFIKGNYTGRKL